MKAYKAKANTRQGMLVKLIGGASLVPKTVRIQAVSYSGMEPNNKLHLYDGDRDEFVHPFSGQNEPKVVVLDSPVTVKEPIYALDESGEPNQVVVYGEFD